MKKLLIFAAVAYSLAGVAMISLPLYSPPAFATGSGCGYGNC